MCSSEIARVRAGGADYLEETSSVCGRGVWEQEKERASDGERERERERERKRGGERGHLCP